MLRKSLTLLRNNILNNRRQIHTSFGDIETAPRILITGQFKMVI